MDLRHSDVLDALEKAVTANTLADLVPEDLEVTAHEVLWNQTDPHELTMMKMIPRVPATNVEHEYTRINSYGFRRNSGFFAETSLPPSTEFSTQRVVTNIKLMGEVSETFILAALEKTQRAMGEQGAANIARAALQKNVMYKANRNIYKSDTRTHAEGDGGTRFQGLEQLIREGTDGTVGTSPFGSHVIDLQGEPLTPETIRARGIQSLIQFGMFNCLVMDPSARGDFEAQLDAAQRLNLPIGYNPYMIGQSIGGIRTNGSPIFFHTDNVLSPIHYGGQYTTTLVRGAPSTRPAVAVSVGATTGGRVSSWLAKDQGSYFWIITEMVDEREGLGTRIPAGSAVQAVAADQQVTLTVTAGNPLAHTLRIYRGVSGQTDTEAYWMRDVANSDDGSAVVIYDLNDDRPGTSRAFGLRITTAATKAMNSGQLDAYATAQEQSSNFIGMPDRPDNTIAFAQLGPGMGVMELARVLPTVQRPLLYMAGAPQCRNPLQNFVFKNIGSLTAPYQL